jgi:hypothetical protein
MASSGKNLEESVNSAAQDHVSCNPEDLEYVKKERMLQILKFMIERGSLVVFVEGLQHYMLGLEGTIYQRVSYTIAIFAVIAIVRFCLLHNVEFV